MRMVLPDAVRLERPVAAPQREMAPLPPAMSESVFAPHVLVLCPPPFDGHELSPSFAAELDCDLLDLDGIAAYPVVDGDVCHLDEGGQAAIASAVAERIRTAFA